MFTFCIRYTKPEKLGPGQYTCSKCESNMYEASKELSIKKLPPVLSFQLKVTKGITQHVPESYVSSL
jgi:ubiquitin C-terminal hydrolase